MVNRIIERGVSVSLTVLLLSACSGVGPTSLSPAATGGARAPIASSKINVDVNSLPTHYTINPLGTIPSYDYFYANGLKASGVISGYAYSATLGQTAVVYRNSAATKLLAPIGQESYRAYGVNSSGTVVGSSLSPIDRYHATSWDFNGNPTDLQPMNSLWTRTQAFAINNEGVVVGEGSYNAGFGHAALFSNGTVADLGTLPGDVSSVALAINDRGDVVGLSGNSAVQFSSGRVTAIGSLPNTNRCQSLAVNSRKHIAGNCSDNNGTYGFFYNDSMLAIGTAPGKLYSDVTGMNKYDTIVGIVQGGTQPDAGFLSQSGKIYLLLDLLHANSGWTYLEARSINDAGDIVGEGYLQRSLRAFKMTPAV